MVYQARKPVTSEIEDTIYACRDCGAELIRTCKAPPRRVSSAEAA